VRTGCWSTARRRYFRLNGEDSDARTTKGRVGTPAWLALSCGRSPYFIPPRRILSCFIFTKGYEGNGIGEGVRFGLLIGLFMFIPMAIDQFVVYPITGELAMI
jgi:hypothetical protein